MYETKVMKNLQIKKIKSSKFFYNFFLVSFSVQIRSKCLKMSNHFTNASSSQHRLQNKFLE